MSLSTEIWVFFFLQKYLLFVYSFSGFWVASLFTHTHKKKKKQNPHRLLDMEEQERCG